MANITVRQKQDFDILADDKNVGCVTRWPKSWTAMAFDAVGNIYHLGDFATKDLAVSRVVEKHAKLRPAQRKGNDAHS